MTQSRRYTDPTNITHQSNREKNDFLADTLKQLNSDARIINIVRIDEDEWHGWLINFD